MLKKLIFIVVGLLSYSVTQAELHLELTQGIDSAWPIAIVPFNGQANDPNLTDVAGVIQQDLQNSGRFRTLDPGNMTQFPQTASNIDKSYWRGMKVNDVVIGSIKPMSGGLYQISFSLVNIYAKPVDGASPATQGVLASQTFTAGAPALRAVAHRIADIIYQEILNKRGIFSTKIAYVVVRNSDDYSLEVADYDGYNPQTILSSTAPVMSPAWSPDGKQIAYVSFERGNPAIYIHTLATGMRVIASNSMGINGAPAFSPDGKKLALVLTLNSAPNVYVKDLSSGQVQQITRDNAIDTEPAWSPDGSSLLYTSDRGGSPQIYQYSFATGKSMRLTYNGSYNARASFTPDGQSIVLLHRDEAGVYAIAIQNLATGRLQVLAEPPVAQAPSVAPNGDMVIYNFSNDSGKVLLGMVSTDGKVQIQLPMRGGNVRDPAWSPFLG